MTAYLFNGIFSTDASSADGEARSTGAALATVGGMAVVIGGTTYLLHKLNSLSQAWAGQFEPSTQLVVRKAYSTAWIAHTLTLVPGIVVRRYGLGAVGLYKVVYSTVWLGLAAWGGTALLYGLAMVQKPPPPSTPVHRDPKWALFAASTLTAGTMLAPVFTAPSGFLVIAGVYTAAMALPLSVVAAVARNRLFLNVGGALAMLLGLTAAHSDILPALLPSDASVVQGSTASYLSSVAFVFAAAAAGALLFSANSLFSRAQGSSYFDSDQVTELIEERALPSEVDAQGNAIVKKKVRTTTKTAEPGSTIAPRNFLANLALEGVETDDYRGMALLINAQVAASFVKIVWVLIKAAAWPVRSALKLKRTKPAQ